MKSIPLVGTALLAALVASAGPAAAALNVVTTTEDLASIVREVGGDRVKVDALARGREGGFVQLAVLLEVAEHEQARVRGRDGLLAAAVGPLHYRLDSFEQVRGETRVEF